MIRDVIRVCLAGITGWVGRPLGEAIAAAEDLQLVAAGARSARGQNVASVTVSGSVEDALRAPFEVFVDFTSAAAVKAVGLLAGGHEDPAGLIRGVPIRRSGAVGDPDARASSHHGLQGRDEATRRVKHRDLALLRALVYVRLAVGDDDDLLAMQVAAERLFQALWCPGAAFLLGLLLVDDPIDQIADVSKDRLELGPIRTTPEKAPDLVAPVSPGEPGGHHRHARGGQGQ
jgi:dihydrodipicolinate reductase-like protein